VTGFSACPYSAPSEARAGISKLCVLIFSPCPKKNWIKM
jgi:hypothetical protein